MLFGSYSKILIEASYLSLEELRNAETTKYSQTQETKNINICFNAQCCQYGLSVKLAECGGGLIQHMVRKSRESGVTSV